MQVARRIRLDQTAPKKFYFINYFLNYSAYLKKPVPFQQESPFLKIPSGQLIFVSI